MEQEIPLETEELRWLRREHRLRLRAIPDADLHSPPGIKIPALAPEAQPSEHDRPVVELSLRQLAARRLEKNSAALRYLRACEATLSNRMARRYLTKISANNGAFDLAFVEIGPMDTPKPDGECFKTVRAFALLTVLADQLASDGYTDSRI